MSTETERTAVQAHKTAIDVEEQLHRRIQIEHDCSSRNDQEHGQIRDAMNKNTAALEDLTRIAMRQGKHLKLRDAAIALAVVFVPVFQTVAQAYSNDHIRDVAAAQAMTTVENIEAARRAKEARANPSPSTTIVLPTERIIP
jgi:hypothetical protein